MRLAIIASHPIQYYAPLFRTLADRLDLTVFYSHRVTQADQAKAGFGIGFDWDVDLLSGYRSEFLANVSRQPGLGRFGGVDTPEVGNRLRYGRFDAVLLMGWHLKSMVQALLAAKSLGIPVMVRGDSHLGTPRAFWKRLAKRLAYPTFLRLFDAALIVGERNRAYWRYYGYPKTRMFDAPHCVDNEWFADRATSAARTKLRRRLSISSDVKLLLFAGKLVSFKRPADLLEAAALVRASGNRVELAFAGAGPLEQELRARCAALALPSHFLGFCNQTEMPATYAAADLLVLPSNGRETWGLVANEALACGCPVVLANSVGCAPDMARHLGKRVLFAMGEIHAVAECIEVNIALPPPVDVIGRAAEAFSLGSAAAGIEHAFNKMVIDHS